LTRTIATRASYEARVAMVRVKTRSLPLTLQTPLVH